MEAAAWREQMHLYPPSNTPPGGSGAFGNTAGAGPSSPRPSSHAFSQYSHAAAGQKNSWALEPPARLSHSRFISKALPLRTHATWPPPSKPRPCPHPERSHATRPAHLAFRSSSSSLTHRHGSTPPRYGASAGTGGSLGRSQATALARPLV